jgi:hypothetical protein
MKRILAGLVMLIASLSAFAGKPCTTCTDLAPTVVSGTFTGTANGTSSQFLGLFNLELSGTWVGTVVLERSFDGGTTFVSAAKDTSGTAASYTTNVSIVVSESEPGVIYRVRCSAYTSGTIAYRLSAGPRPT